MTTEIAPGIIEIDTLLGGWERVTAGYLVDGDRAACSWRRAARARCRRSSRRSTSLGVGPDDLAGVAVTHIHLDHAGGVGDVARAFPVGHRLRPREGRAPPGRPDAARRLGRARLRDAARLALRPARPHARRADPRARRRRGDPGRARTASSPRSTRPDTPSTTSPCTTR